MKVKRLYVRGKALELSTSELIVLGASDDGGHLERLQNEVANLRSVVAELLDMAGLSDKEVLRITGACRLFEPSGD